MKVLQVIENAYRCNVEEQDDPAVWITRAMKGAGADLGVLLQGNAVNYAVKGQNAEGLSFGDKTQTQPPNLPGDIAALAGSVDVYLVQDDAAERGLEGSELIEGIKPVGRKSVAKLFADYDQVWYW
jgi:sulfur relay (sulfurtransferase) DsrF/TusC family protein